MYTNKKGGEQMTHPAPCSEIGLPMRLALSGHSALSALRELRASGVDLSKLPKTTLPEPDPSPRKRWTKPALSEKAWSYAHKDMLEVTVPTAKTRIRTSGIECIVCSPELLGNSYIHIGDGLYIPSPELLFVQMGRHLSPIAHALLGMELCGTYVRPKTYGVGAVTTAQQLASFAENTQRVDGVLQARKVARRVLDNAWSPMESIVAQLASLPLHEMGYGLGPLDLNPRIAGQDMQAGSRVPDIVVRGTMVGLNYEGEGHLDLPGIVSATTEAVLNPGSSASQQALDAAIAKTREKYVGDRRRDRDLWQAGLTVFPVTKEDLYQEGAFDSLMLSVYAAIERSAGRSMRYQRERILDTRLKHERQLRIWSLLPGDVGRRARDELRAELPNSAPYQDYLLEEDDGLLFFVPAGEGTHAFAKSPC